MILKRLPKFGIPTFLIHKKFAAVVFLFLVIIAASLAFYWTGNISSLSPLFLQEMQGQSTARIYMDGQRIKADFQILPRDEKSFQAFVRNLGVDDSFREGLSVGVDKETANALQVFLPAEINITVFPEKVEFNSKKAQAFSQAKITEKALESAASDGDIKVQRLGDNRYEIEIDNPYRVLVQATSSGILRLSPQLASPGFQLASRFAKIKLQVSAYLIEGALILH